MVKNIFVCLLMLTALQTQAQSNHSFAGKGLLKANLTYGQSMMLQHRTSNVYINGNLEYYTSQFLSIRGDCYWYLDSRSKDPVIKNNGIVSFGAILHKQAGHSDLNFGIQPGISFTRPMPAQNLGMNYPYRVMPSLAISAGYTFYFARFCNFFFGATWITSRYRGTPEASVKLDEIIFTGGLGFQIRTRKQ